LYFERGPFQVRGSLNYRDQYLRAVPGPFNVDVAGVPAATFVDFSTSYGINDNLTVSLEGLNLTNEEGVLWVDSQAQRQEEFRMSGRFLNLGLRYTF
jgi:iron complex outermembrane receptor protein